MNDLGSEKSPSLIEDVRWHAFLSKVLIFSPTFHPVLLIVKEVVLILLVSNQKRSIESTGANL